ncbi:DUF2844 domain-containing protein [Ramlibacter tataouinensis]|uniref:DUF2844 domain-containing protein n=1 Tax=Ramlibacter tataouinensis TaxID=94132 RepID=UPI0022F3973C|nr:DUF2844 domain-containing protein [Ramlibacter tataouinensis]WBY01702.1 DUF2844 domain-containing protein [Ramlibacter tataouinensis]
MKRLLAASLLAAFSTGWAALGDPATPRGPAPGVTVATLRTPAGAAYTRVQQRLDSGTTVSEYVDAQGIVFAVGWAGPFLPELQALLGRHYASFEQHAKAVGRSPSVVVRQPGLVIVSSGRMGAFQGHAWLPAGLPLGFDTRGLQ